MNSGVVMSVEMEHETQHELSEVRRKPTNVVKVLENPWVEDGILQNQHSLKSLHDYVWSGNDIVFKHKHLGETLRLGSEKTVCVPAGCTSPLKSLQHYTILC